MSYNNQYILEIIVSMLLLIIEGKLRDKWMDEGWNRIRFAFSLTLFREGEIARARAALWEMPENCTCFSYKAISKIIIQWQISGTHMSSED